MASRPKKIIPRLFGTDPVTIERDNAYREVRDLKTEVHRLERLAEKQGAHIEVLAGDRDALTRTIEVLSRRLASPLADHDPSRAGWRAWTSSSKNAQPGDAAELASRSYR